MNAMHGLNWNPRMVAGAAKGNQPGRSCRRRASQVPKHLAGTHLQARPGKNLKLGQQVFCLPPVPPRHTQCPAVSTVRGLISAPEQIYLDFHAESKISICPVVL